MKPLFFISILIIFLHAESVLVINSNAKVKKYTQAIDAFGKNFKHDFSVIDISQMSAKTIKNYLYDEYPDTIYAVGAKAYQYANEYLPEKTIYFSSIIDYGKFPMQGKRYGIINELHNEMQLTLIKSVFPDVRSLGVIYSEYTQNIMNDLRQNAQKVGITITPLKISEHFNKRTKVEKLVKTSDAFMIIPDPVFLSDEARVEEFFDISKQYKKAVIAYHELFINYGAVLAISVDNPTIGRQIAMMMQSHQTNEQIVPIQYPAGTHIIFNQHEATDLGVAYNPNISQIATKILE